MAHAGTPTDLAKQPETSTSFWKPFLSAIVILALGVSVAIAASFLNQASNAPAVDRGYDAIEKTRGALSLSGGIVSSDAIQKAAAAKARAMSGVAADTSYEAVEKARGAATLSGTSIDPTTFDRTPRGAHGQLP
jgi:hypothetical protein